MKRFLLILLFLNAIVCTYSQISFSGKINTETGAPLKDVQIMLLKNDTIVALASTDAKGRFALKNLSPDTYNIELSALGYSSVNKEISLTEDLSEDFVLREKDIQLDSVLVTTERPRVTTATGHIYYLSKKARESGNPYKALQEST
ncbi:carboxypeptidase-like regulatory domain-containing protein [Xylanibacter rarus]|uniref:carboxypeptidase-like regulatory domain-containing protein n=1 Tax=Xylanibacter rarus TaxID=1676614 RepID=UPI003FEFD756